MSPLVRLAGEGAVASYVFCPGPDFRRVVRELWPELPGALAPMRGELADRWLHLEAAINPPPNLIPRSHCFTAIECGRDVCPVMGAAANGRIEFGGNEKSVAQAKVWPS